MTPHDVSTVTAQWAQADKAMAARIPEAILQIGLEIQEQMIHNISGAEVAWQGGAFRVNIVTGNLRRRTQLDYPYQGDPASVMVYNDAEYAGMIESGISGPAKRDLILFGGRAPKRNKRGRAYKRIPGSRGSLIPFWTLTEDTELRDQPARPFVEATAEQMKERALELLGDAVLHVMKGSKT